MSIIAESQGIFDTIQDTGRPGYRSFGVPVGGWFDADSAARANALAGNEPDAPCLEITLQSGLFRAEAPMRIAIAGPGAVIELARGDRGTETWRESIATMILPGDSFRIRHTAQGLRSYVAVPGGGWAGRPILGSVSSENRLIQGMRLSPRSDTSQNPAWNSNRTLANWPDYARPNRGELAFVSSGEFERHSRAADVFGSMRWIMSDRSDRVGVRFMPDPNSSFSFDLPRDPARLSEPVVPGTIQWTGSELIILGVAGGTMGGYPVLGYLARSEMPKLAQVRPGEIVLLRPVALETAWTMTETHETDLRKSLTRIRLANAGP